MLTLAEARETGCCRLCGGRILEPGDKPMGYPQGWKDCFGEIVFPICVVLNYGKEFAHKHCVEEQDA